MIKNVSVSSRVDKDRSGAISDTELQQALSNGMFIFSHFFLFYYFLVERLKDIYSAKALKYKFAVSFPFTSFYFREYQTVNKRNQVSFTSEQSVSCTQ